MSGGQPLAVTAWLSLDFSRHIPRQQLSHLVDRMLADALQHMAQVRLRVEPIEFGRAQQTVDSRSTLAPSVLAHEQEVFPAKGNGPDLPLCCVVIHLDAPINGVARERLPAAQAVANGTRQLRLR